MIRIGQCQCKLEFERPEENLAMMERFLFYAQGCEGKFASPDVRTLHGRAGGEKNGVSSIAAKKADLLLFPELTLTGFTMRSEEFAVTQESEMLERVREMAVRYETAVGFGCVMDRADLKNKKEDPQNTYFIISKEGQLLADYAKLHPFSFAGEDRHYSSGNALSTFSLNGVRFGITVCYDLRFPEIYQAYADTCDAILVAANWPAKRAEHWNALLKARAIETQCYVAAVNCVGDMDGQYYRGDSQVIGPDGKYAACEWKPVPPDAESSLCERDHVSLNGKYPPCGRNSVSPVEECPPYAGEEGILFAGIDEEQVRRSRETFPVRQDRRKEFYRSL